MARAFSRFKTLSVLSSIAFLLLLCELANGQDETSSTPLTGQARENLSDPVALDSVSAPKKIFVDGAPFFVGFASGSSDLTPKTRDVVKDCAIAIMKRKVTRLKLIGYSDPVGNAQYNLALSLRRAQAVATALAVELQRMGYNELAIESEGKGVAESFDASVLSDRQSQEARWRRDRRVEAVITGSAGGLARPPANPYVPAF